jgi:hypothetical protein
LRFMWVHKVVLVIEKPGAGSMESCRGHVHVREQFVGIRCEKRQSSLLVARSLKSESALRWNRLDS